MEILTLDLFYMISLYHYIIKKRRTPVRLRRGLATSGRIAEERAAPDLSGLSPPSWLPWAFWDDHGYLLCFNDDSMARYVYVYLEGEDRRLTICELEVYSQEGSDPCVCAIILYIT